MPEQPPSADEVRAALDEVLGWQGISRSPQLTELLRYVVEKTLSGDGGSIKAYSIAVDVFGRPQSFDPQADPIVRVQARRLRTLLEQFYDGGNSASLVHIRLPLGRYVPEFLPVTATPTVAARTASNGAAPPARPQATRRLPRFLFNALLGLCFTLIGVGLAVALIRWALPTNAPSNSAVPDFPQISVGTFDNLTGDSALDADIAQFGPRVGAALGKFDALRVSPDASGLALHGSVQENAGRFAVRALLSEGAGSGILWSATISPPDSTDAAEALADAAVLLTAQLGNGSGPLHATGRLWLKSQSKLPTNPPLYVCDLLYMAWRDDRQLADANNAIACFDGIVAAEPDNAAALAAGAGVKAWRLFYLAGPNDDLLAAMVDQTTAAARAISLQPADGFVYEQQGLVLARQGSLDAALGALSKAVELNPANMDAVAARGLVSWLTLAFDTGNALSEQALAAIPSPPPWYYTTRAFNALRERRYYDAMDAAQALAAGDTEYGPVIALAAAPVVGRNDIIDRYRPQVLAYPYFQASGVLPRVAMLMKPQALLDRVREGLILAGIPPNAVAGPFNPDGTAKN